MLMCMFEETLKGKGGGMPNFPKLLDFGKSIFTYKTYLNFAMQFGNSDYTTLVYYFIN